MDPNTLVKEWQFRVYRLQLAHYNTATYLERLNLWLGIIVIILSTAVGTAIFATLSKSPSIVAQIVVGLLSVAAGQFMNNRRLFHKGYWRGQQEQLNRTRMDRRKQMTKPHDKKVDLRKL